MQYICIFSVVYLYYNKSRRTKQQVVHVLALHVDSRCLTDNWLIMLYYSFAASACPVRLEPQELSWHRKLEAERQSGHGIRQRSGGSPLSQPVCRAPAATHSRGMHHAYACSLTCRWRWAGRTKSKSVLARLCFPGWVGHAVSMHNIQRPRPRRRAFFFALLSVSSVAVGSPRIISLFISSYTIIDYLLLTSLVWEKNIIPTYNSHSYTTKRTDRRGVA